MYNVYDRVCYLISGFPKNGMRPASGLQTTESGLQKD